MADGHSNSLRMQARRDSLDTLRGITLVSMIAYHTCWDFVEIMGQDWRWYHSYGAYLWQQSICWTFILLSGFCFHLGVHPVRRGNLIFWSGVLITELTLWLVPENRIFFGVLSLLGSAVLLTALLEPLLRQIPSFAGLTASFILFLFTRHVSAGTLGLGGVFLLRLPVALYHSNLTACLGFPPPGFFSTDYFPLLPWLFLFWTGYFLFSIRPPSDKPFWNTRLPILTAMGRHSLLIYLLHQPVIMGIMFIQLAIWMFFEGPD